MNLEPIELNAMEDEQEPITLAALDEGVRLPDEKPPSSRRRKLLFTLLALALLVAVTAAGGYYLLRGKRVELKANKPLPEKVASGKDIKQAAFDSLSDALIEPVKAPQPTNASSAQPPTSAPGSLADFSTTSGSERVAAPIQPGLAATLAPPPEAMAGGVAEAASLRQETNAKGAQPAAQVPINNAERRTAITQSIRVARSVQPTTGAYDKAVSHVEPSAPPALSHVVDHPVTLSAAPAFGAMLPVRLLGALYTLRQGALARLELTRDIQAGGEVMRRGTIFIADVQGSNLERAYLQISGFLHPDTRAFIKLEGEVLGNDGGAGLRGKQRRISPTWVRVLDRTAEAGVQLATGILNRRSSSVIVAADPYGTVRSDGQRSDQNRSFVEVAAGATGFVLVTTLPSATAHLAQTNTSVETLTDEELAALMTEADPARIRAALPRMKQRVAWLVLKEREAEKR